MKRANRTIYNADNRLSQGDVVSDDHPLARRRPEAFDTVTEDGRTLPDHTVAELRDLADDLDLEVPSGALKDELIATITPVVAPASRTPLTYLTPDAPVVAPDVAD